MKALVYRGKGTYAWEDKPNPPLITDTDAVIAVKLAKIFRTNPSIWVGEHGHVSDGLILGNEGVGVVLEIGSNVEGFQAGDAVYISGTIGCGNCGACRSKIYSRCTDGEWVFGSLIDGTQAEYVRVPQADLCLRHIPKKADEVATVMRSQVLPAWLRDGFFDINDKLGDAIVITNCTPKELVVENCQIIEHVGGYYHLWEGEKHIYYGKTYENDTTNHITIDTFQNIIAA